MTPRAQACYPTGQAAEKARKALTRMNSESRYPQDEEAPADLFDGRDSELALATAAAVVQNSAAHLAG